MNRPLDSTVETPRTCPKNGFRLWSNWDPITTKATHGELLNALSCLVEPIGIDHAEGIGCGTSQRGSKRVVGWRRATRSSRRDAARSAREQPKVRSKEAEPGMKEAARRAAD